VKNREVLEVKKKNMGYRYDVQTSPVNEDRGEQQFEQAINQLRQHVKSQGHIVKKENYTYKKLLIWALHRIKGVALGDL
jgi:hypothetical protein